MSVALLVFAYQCVEGSTNSRALTTTSVPSAPAPDKYYLNQFSFLANIFHRDSVGREWWFTSAAEQCLACLHCPFTCAFGVSCEIQPKLLLCCVILS